jgi:hypothetical protein
LYLEEGDHAVAARVLEHLADRGTRESQPTRPAIGYAAADLDVFFGGRFA